MNNIVSYKSICIPWSKMAVMTDGHIYGVMVISLLKRSTDIYVAVNQLVKLSTKFSSGCC
jgi:hypothetical protein